MPIGEFTKYGLVFGSSLIGAVSGYFYSSRPLNLRMKLERQGIRVLRSSDQLWMYERLVKRNKTEIEEVLKADKPEAQTAVETTTSGTPSTKTESELALELLNWCQQRLTEPKWKSDSKVQEQVIRLCAFPDWMK